MLVLDTSRVQNLVLIRVLLEEHDLSIVHVAVDDFDARLVRDPVAGA